MHVSPLVVSLSRLSPFHLMDHTIVKYAVLVIIAGVALAFVDTRSWEFIVTAIATFRRSDPL